VKNVTFALKTINQLVWVVLFIGCLKREERILIYGGRNKSQETRAKKQEPRNKNQETRAKKQEPRNKKQETRNKKQEERNKKKEKHY